MAFSLLDLIDLLTQFQAVERTAYIPQLKRPDNDAEHSYNLAMAAWLIITTDKLPLDLDLVLEYALVHDLVEVYAGDTFALDEAQIAAKPVKEKAALAKLAGQPLTAEWAALIEHYEKMADEESRFVYGLDKLMPVFQCIHGQVPIWRDNGMTQAAWEAKFRPKIEQSQYLATYLEQVIALQKKHPALFAD